MYFAREIKEKIIQSAQAQKVIIISGIRRAGKTFLLKELMNEIKGESLYFNGDDLSTHEIFENIRKTNFQRILKGKDLLFIDEAHQIPEIGWALKLIVDEIPNIKIVITGSSAYRISNTVSEPLAGRKKTFTLYPLSEREFLQHENLIEKKDNLSQRLIFGTLPEITNIQSNKDKIDYLKELLNSFLLRDILSFGNIKNSTKIFNLLKLLSFQTGQLVSVHELSKNLKMQYREVEKYLDIFYNLFIIYPLYGYSGNLRKEITKMNKWYFYDLGLKNAMINNFNSISDRNDIGSLWENYMINERIKYQQFFQVNINNYFWRTYDQQEIDLIEEKDGNLSAYEFKWKTGKTKIPAAWGKNYLDSTFEVITKDNFFEWLS